VKGRNTNYKLVTAQPHPLENEKNQRMKCVLNKTKWVLVKTPQVSTFSNLYYSDDFADIADFSLFAFLFCIDFSQVGKCRYLL
jgi:hypothetical protein